MLYKQRKVIPYLFGDTLVLSVMLRLADATLVEQGNNYNDMNQQGYGQNQPYPQNNMNDPNADGERGLGKALLVGAGAAAAGITAYAAYKIVTKKKKKKVKTKKGKSRKVNCDVIVDDKGRELPGQEFDESGRCINEREVIAEAAKSGLIEKKDSQPGKSEYGQNAPQMGNQGYVNPTQGYGAPQNTGYNQPPPSYPGYNQAPPSQPGYPNQPQNVGYNNTAPNPGTNQPRQGQSLPKYATNY